MERVGGVMNLIQMMLIQMMGQNRMRMISMGCEAETDIYSIFYYYLGTRTLGYVGNQKEHLIASIPNLIIAGDIPPPAWANNGILNRGVRTDNGNVFSSLEFKKIIIPDNTPNIDFRLVETKFREFETNTEDVINRLLQPVSDDIKQQLLTRPDDYDLKFINALHTTSGEIKTIYFIRKKNDVDITYTYQATYGFAKNDILTNIIKIYRWLNRTPEDFFMSTLEDNLLINNINFKEYPYNEFLAYAQTVYQCILNAVTTADRGFLPKDYVLFLIRSNFSDSFLNRPAVEYSDFKTKLNTWISEYKREHKRSSDITRAYFLTNWEINDFDDAFLNNLCFVLGTTRITTDKTTLFEDRDFGNDRLIKDRTVFSNSSPLDILITTYVSNTLNKNIWIQLKRNANFEYAISGLKKKTKIDADIIQQYEDEMKSIFEEIYNLEGLQGLRELKKRMNKHHLKIPPKLLQLDENLQMVMEVSTEEKLPQTQTEELPPTTQTEELPPTTQTEELPPPPNTKKRKAGGSIKPSRHSRKKRLVKSKKRGTKYKYKSLRRK
jgi:hypothetical protein